MNSIYETVDFLLESFESIYMIEVKVKRIGHELKIYLTNKYCDYDVSISSIKELLSPNDLDNLIFIKG